MAADLAWSDVVTLAPELSGVTEARIDIIAHVLEVVNPAAFGGEGSFRLRLARIYLAAHYGTMYGRGGSSASGPVISESMGGLSRTYANYTTSTLTGGSGLSATSYGQMYLDIVNSSAGARGPIVI